MSEYPDNVLSKCKYCGRNMVLLQDVDGGDPNSPGEWQHVDSRRAAAECPAEQVNRAMSRHPSNPNLSARQGELINVDFKNKKRL